MKNSRLILLLSVPVLISVVAGMAMHASSAEKSKAPHFTPGSVTRVEGLEAWNRVHAVVSHPRCANCHVGTDNVPMWSLVGEAKPRPHGMNINAGPSRIGSETLACSTCHMTTTAPNKTPHAAPHVGLPWQLAPATMEWFGKTEAEVCAQLKDPARNGGRDGNGLVEHLIHDADIDGFIPWAWEPGGGRETPPGNFEKHVLDMSLWVAAGQPCP